MRRLCLLTGMVCLAAQPLLAGSLEDRVREAARTTYIHGMTQEIADREVGTEGVPYLLELLRDPDFPRRDNVVAFLAYLAYDSESQALADFLSSPRPADKRAADVRARLIVPEALGRIAARGGSVAADVLRQIADDPDRVEANGLSSRLEYGLTLAASTEPEGPSGGIAGDGAEPPPVPTQHDTSEYISLHELSYANHVDTNTKITDAETDALMREITRLISTDWGDPAMACCVQEQRLGEGGLFGTSGDGFDVIDNGYEMGQVMAVDIARVKVVDYIGYCGGYGTNILGCSPVPGDTMVVTRMSGPTDEGRLWGHEYGHNMGLQHNPNGGYIMYAFHTAVSNRLSLVECFRHHFPNAAANAVQTDHGVCEDNDGDDVMSSADNCPSDPNTGQEDCDSDGMGDVCDAENFVPGPVESIWFQTEYLLSWTPSEYDKRVYRGSFMQAPWEYNHVQVQEVASDRPFWFDPTMPAIGWVNYYLVAHFNDCGESP